MALFDALSSLSQDLQNNPFIQKLTKGFQAATNPASLYPSLSAALFGIALPPYLMEQFRQYSREPLNYYTWRSEPENVKIGGHTVGSAPKRMKEDTPYGRPGIYVGFRAAEPANKTGLFTKGEGIYMTMDPNYAERYTSQAILGGSKGATVMHQVIAPVKQPLNLDDATNKNLFWRVLLQYGTEGEKKVAEINIGRSKAQGMYHPMQRQILPQSLSPQSIQQFRKMGYDAIYSSNELEGTYPSLIYLNPDKAHMVPIK